MSLSIRMERVHKVKGFENRLWKFKIAVTDSTGITRVLKELGLTNIRYMRPMAEGDAETIYDVVATQENGKTIGIRGDGPNDWEFAGYGKEVEVERLSRRFVDLLGAYHTMAVLGVQGIGYQVSKNENRIIIQVA